jgi:hypothetical protein
VVASYGKATVPSNDPTQSVKVTFATAMTGDATLSGTAEARPCGRRKRSSPIPPKSEQKALSLEIDGQKVSVMGAKYEASREQVFLSSGGVTCGEDPIEELVDLRLSKEDLLLFGLSVNADELKFDDPPKFTVGKPANGSVDATFNVDAKVQGHRVKLTGKAKLNACE